MVCPAASGWWNGSAELLGAGTVGTPAWRGDRQFFMRRTAEQEHAVLLTVDPDGTERVLVDPVAIDASGSHHPGRVAAVQGGPPARLPALRRWHRGVGAARHRRRDGRSGRGPDRPGPLLAGRLAARRRGVLLRTPGARRAGARGRGAVPPAGLAAPGRHRPRDRRRGAGRRAGHDQLLRRHRVDGRPVAGRRRIGRHRTAQRPVAGRPVRRPARLADAAGRAGGRGREHVAARRPGRTGVRLHGSGRAPRPAGGDDT